MNRRSFLSVAGLKSNSGKKKNFVGGRTNSGLEPYTGPWTTNEVIHLLKRTMFGAKPDDVRYFETRTMDQAVNELLTITSPLPNPPVKDYDTGEAEFPDNLIAPGTTWVNDFNEDNRIGNLRKRSFKKWWIGVLLNQHRDIREKMALFWHNHFATEMASSNNGRYAYRHHMMLRNHALGNFKELAKQITIDPLMLVYQNGEHNRKGAPDENFARELQELFTLGKENYPNYTEDDVKSAARVLTGWRNDPGTNTSYFDAKRHDTGNKTFSSFYNNTTITGRSGDQAGEQELDDLMDMIFSKGKEASEFIVRKLYRWFVYYEIDEATKMNVIEPLALMLRNYNWEITPVLSTLLKCEHFFDSMNQGCMIKSPIDFLVGFFREGGVALPDETDYTTWYAMLDGLLYQLELFQQAPGDPPSVSGWPAYYQIPAFHELWINNDTYPRRTQFTDTMLSYGFMRSGFELKFDSIAFARSLSNPGNPKALLDDALSVFYRIVLSESAREQLKRDILLTGQSSDYYWTNAWNTYIANPSDVMAYQTVLSRLNELFRYLLALPEYQLS